jgi:RNA polymerase sigma-70 factor, ECF subfamily
MLEARGVEPFMPMKPTKAGNPEMSRDPAISLVRLVPPSGPRSAPTPSDPYLGITPEDRVSTSPEGALIEPALDLDGLFRRYAPYVAAIAHRLLGRDEDVDDTIQEVFVAAVRGVHAVRDPAAIRGWLARVTVRVAHQRLRKRRARIFLGLDEPVVYDAVVDKSASAEQRTLLARVYKILDSMPANERIAWSLRHIEGEPLESVASMSGCSLATAKRRIAAAAGKLEEAFGDV